MNPFLLLLLAVLLIVVFIVLLRTMTFTKTWQPIPAEDSIAVDPSLAAEHLSKAIQIETVSFKEGQPPASETLLALHQLLAEMYPLVHKRLVRQMINDYSLFYTWQGTRPELPGVLFMAHQDVVPADPATLEAWTHPPFSGKITEDSVWGRGTLDIKSQIIGTLEAVEELLKAGYQPERTIYLAYGHDEEIGGLQGAAKVAAYMEAQGIRLEAVLDEGGVVAEGMLPGVDVPLALVGIGEKGYLSLELSVEAEPGHSSTPPRNTAIGILARAITRLESNPLPAQLYILQNLFQAAGKQAPFLYRLVFANLWLTGGIVQRMMAAKGETNALIRTTTAATMISGGVKDNILPREARATVNFRLMPGDTIESITTVVRRIINDERVRLPEDLSLAGWDPSPLSPVDVPAYHLLEKTIRQSFENFPVSPYLMLGASDARNYHNVCDHVYRFMPLLMKSEDLKLIHGIDEHINIEGLQKMVQFYALLMQTWSKAAE
jgi:carboxypeptidase PM20D1